MTLLTTTQAASMLGIQAQTLRNWRIKGIGPEFIRYGAPLRGKCYYSLEMIEKWLNERKFSSTASETVNRD